MLFESIDDYFFGNLNNYVERIFPKKRKENPNKYSENFKQHVGQLLKKMLRPH